MEICFIGFDIKEVRYYSLNDHQLIMYASVQLWDQTIPLTTVRVELRERHPDFKINQTDFMVDVLGGYSKGLGEKLTTILGKNCDNKIQSVRAMQETILLHAIRIIKRVVE